jgi:hypothetical protein
MISGVAFDIYKPLFTAAKVADLSGVKRPVIDTMGTRGFIRASGREQPATPRAQSRTTGRRPRAPKGRPLFSTRDVFKVRLMRVLAAQLDVGLTESGFMADKAEKPDESVKRTIAEYEAALVKAADTIAMTGEWMWAMARSIERGTPFYIYAYATRSKNKWEFDMHVENPGVEKPSEPPCFGWTAPNLYVPIGKIFIDVYNDCKKLLGISMESANSKGV